MHLIPASILIGIEVSDPGPQMEAEAELGEHSGMLSFPNAAT